MVRLCISIYILFSICSCVGSVTCVDGGIPLTEAEEKMFDEYVKKNIKPADDSYKGQTTVIEEVRYPGNKVDEAYQKLFPKKIAEAGKTFGCTQK